MAAGKSRRGNRQYKTKYRIGVSIPRASSVKPRRPFSSPRSDPMCRLSQQPDTFALGPVCAHGFMKVPVSAFLRKPAKALHGSKPLLSKPLGQVGLNLANRITDAFARWWAG